MLSVDVQAQYSVSGYVCDNSGKALTGVNVVLLNRDSVMLTGTTSDPSGKYIIHGIPSGSYMLRASFVGFASFTTNIVITSRSIELSRIALGEDVMMLGEISITEILPAVSLNGDTTEYNAASYRVTPDATAEDLVRKMPGVSIEDGKVMANGEEVKKVLVDGKEFFGDDASIAFKNLPAEIVDMVQIYDKQSDMAEFTGFKDGETTKTMNLRTKNGKNNGWFGKLSGGYGTGNSFIVNGNISYFKNDMRISVLGLTNNINQQNFSMQDLLGVASSSGGRGGMGGPPPGGGGSNGPPAPPGAEGMSNSMTDFFVGQNSGLNTNHSFGVNYVDEWGKKISVSSSYFFNRSLNNTVAETHRTYYGDAETGLLYDAGSQSKATNDNHRFTMRFEYRMSDRNSLLVTPSISFQSYKSSYNTQGNSYYADNTPLSETQYDYTGKTSGYTGSNTILFRHKFEKTGRTFSLSLAGGFNTADASTDYDSETRYSLNPHALRDVRKTESNNLGYNFSLTGNYTEPLGQYSQLMLSASASETVVDSRKRTWERGHDPHSDFMLDTALSNDFSTRSDRYKTGVSYRYNKDKINLSTGFDIQAHRLQSEQQFPQTTEAYRWFGNVIPKFNFFYHIDKGRFVHVNYTMQTSAPSISMMQNVTDNSNPLSITRGNPDLRQQNLQTLHTAFRTVDKSLTHSFFVVLSGSFSDSYLSSTSVTASSDSLLSDGIMLHTGSQFITYENLNGYRNLRLFASYGFPLHFIRSTITLSSGLSYSRLPSKINAVFNLANNRSATLGTSLSSNISPEIDFRLSYNASYNNVKNTVLSASDDRYYSGNANGRVSVLLWKHLTLSTDASFNHYLGLIDGPGSYLILNAGIGARFLKNNAAELKFWVSDILNENTSFTRNVTNTYYEDVTTQVLQRYFMLTFTYNIRNFAVGEDHPPPPPF